MQEEHRRAIQNNFISLVEQTDLDVMVAALYEKGVFSEQMKEVYEDTNKDARNRKRLLYRDITRRGPQAFGHLLDALRENGYWDFVRDLDPNSSLHPRRPRNPAPGTSKSSGDSNYVSIRTEKNKTKSGSDVNKNVITAPTPPAPPSAPPSAPPDTKDVVDPTEIPRFEVKKSQKFVEDNNGGIALYRTRGRQRGLLVVFSYIEFDGIEPHRSGADVDCKKLKYLFTEFGFKVLVYQDLTKEETLETLHGLKEAVVGVECLFIVVSSHGHARAASSDNDFRCRKGGLVSLSYVLERFNNRNLPALRGVPKVFVFQLCRGSNQDYLTLPAKARADGAEAPGGGGAGAGAGGGRTAADGQPCPASPPPQRLLPQPLERDLQDRIYSDILIAHSTIPGNVSYRDEAEGSWYISALCEVFAAAAHERHVEELFTLVDQRLHAARRVQTSSVDRWGFNRRLYLHPGLYDPDD